MSALEDIPAGPFLVWASAHEIHHHLPHRRLTQAMRAGLQFVLPDDFAAELAASLQATEAATAALLLLAQADPTATPPLMSTTHEHLRTVSSSAHRAILRGHPCQAPRPGATLLLPAQAAAGGGDRGESRP